MSHVLSFARVRWNSIREWNIVIVSVGLLASALLVRPSHLGEDFNIFGSVLFALVGIWSILTINVSGAYLYRLIYVGMSNILIVVYIAIHSALNGNASPFPLYALICVSLSTAGSIAALASPNVHRRFFSYLRIFLAVMAASGIITLALSFATSIFSLRIGQVRIHSYGGESGVVYFPITMGYDIKLYPWIVFTRAQAWFREPGIAQAFYCWAIATAPIVNSIRRFIIFVLLVSGLVLTQSTIGFSLGAIILFLRRVQIGRQMSLLSLGMWLVVAAPVIYYFTDVSVNNEEIGFASKENTASYFDRAFGIRDGVELFLSTRSVLV